MRIPISTSRNVAVVKLQAHELMARIRCQAGYQSALVRMRPGRFDTGTLDIAMDEFPSGKTVLSQGWDLHQFERRMAVPVFTAFLNGRELGDVWFDVPNYLDHRRGVLDTEFGFRVDDPGEVELRLVIIPPDRKRFRWDMVDCLEITPDDRSEAPIEPRRNLRFDQPWLFLHGKTAAEKRADFQRVPGFKQPLSYLEELVRDYTGVAPENAYRVRSSGSAKPKRTPPPYVPLDQVTATAAFLSGSRRWIDLARTSLRRLCSKPSWSLDKHTRLMGGDNDMTVGHPLLSTSMFYHYLRDELTRDEQALALAKAREYGGKLYDFSVLQKRYHTGMGCISSHESGTLLGLGVAAMVFWEQIPEARRWLAWTHGRMIFGTNTGPRDGRNAWSTYGPQFLTYYAAAIHDFAGVDMFRIPFLRNLPLAVWRSIGKPERESDYMMRWIMAAMASYRRLPEAEWAWHQLWELQSRHRGETNFLGWQDMLWHPTQPGHAFRQNLRKSFLFKDTGFAFMRTLDEPASLTCYYQSGVAVGRAGWKHRKRYGMELHDAGADGGVRIHIKDVPITVPASSAYRRGFGTQSVVTVNGAGHYMDGRVLGVRPKEQWISRMLSFRDNDQKTVAQGDNTGAYREELGVLRSRRRVTLDKRKPELLIEDTIRLRKPQTVAARYQCTGRIEQIGRGHYRFHAADLAETMCDAAHGKESPPQFDVLIHKPDQYRIRIRQTQVVLHYIYGMNIKKGKKVAGVVSTPPPRPKYLEIAVPRRTKRATFRVSFQPER